MKNKLSGTKTLFIKNAAILTVTSFFIRGASMFLRIYISAKLGAQGVGLHQLILSVYTLGSGFAGSGIAAAVTRLTAAELAKGTRESARLVVRRCTAFSLAAGMLSAVVISCFARSIGSGWLSDPRTVPSIRVMALILPVISISACIRGYFTARRRIGTNSAGQFAEQTVRVSLTVILLNRLLPMGIEYGCLALVLTDLAAETVCTCVVTAAYYIDIKRSGRCLRGSDISSCGQSPIPEAKVNRAIWDIAAPITASHYLTSLLRTVESTLVPDCLTRSEGSRVRALELFGMVKGMTLPMILFPATILTAFTSLVVPELSRSQALGCRERIRTGAQSAMRVTLTVSILAGGLFMLYAQELGEIIYHEPELGGIVFFLAPFVPLMYAECVSVAILYGLGEQRASLVYGVIDSAVRITLIALLVPRYGMNGFLTVMAVSNILTPVLHMNRLGRVCGCDIDLARWVFEPGLCMALAYAVTRLAERAAGIGTLPDIARVLIGCVIASAVFVSMLLLLQQDITDIIIDIIAGKSRDHSHSSRYPAAKLAALSARESGRV